MTTSKGGKNVKHARLMIPLGFLAILVPSAKKSLSDKATPKNEVITQIYENKLARRVIIWLLISDEIACSNSLVTRPEAKIVCNPCWPVGGIVPKIAKSQTI